MPSCRAGRCAVIFSVVSLTACLDPPATGRAADPAQAPGPAPWGSATTNPELAVKLKLLEEVLDGGITPAQLAERAEKAYPSLSPEERKKQLESIATLMTELQQSGHAGMKVTGIPREMAKAELYFAERRFIEAATMLSHILDENPIYPGARNLLARCFFFLQNRDRTIDELEFVLKNPEQSKNKDEVLDALFLLGATVAESPGMSREHLEQGKGAWELYLQMAPDSAQRPQVEKGLEEIRAALRGEGRLAQALDQQAAGDEAEDPPPRAPEHPSK